MTTGYRSNSATISQEYNRPMPSIEETVRRPVKYLTAIARCYPDLWKQVDKLRANRDKIPHEWPAWCFLPLQGAAGIVALQRGLGDPIHRNIEGAKIATLASWRIAKDVYIFDATVFEELWNTPIEGNIPIDVLHRLPTWCAYVAFPAPRVANSGDLSGAAVHGFYIHLTHSGQGPLLLLSFDFGAVDRIAADQISLAPYALLLAEGSDLLECLTRVHEKNVAIGRQPPEGMEQAIQPSTVKQVLEPLLSLTLYLCSTSAEIRTLDPLRGLRKAYTKKTKKGLRTFVPEEPQVWEVAFRIGATLRAATASTIEHGTSDHGGTHASPRPHIRRAHWHSYWTGPKAAVGKPEVPAREIVVRWIPPIPVAMGLDGEIVPTVHKVTR